MTTTNGWPGKPGVPLNPERDGWHWLSAMHYDDPIGPPVACFWEAKLEQWPRLQDKPGNYPVSCGFCYLGPCLTPDEAAKREDVKWHEGYAVGVLDVRRGTAFGEPDTHYVALQARVAELEAQNEMLRHATDKLRASLTELNDRHEPLQRAFITAVELLNNAALTGGKDE